ncbi:hypothetical protein ABZ837_34845 [Streptomyces sp. NPDC047197]|uniref:hypothetical protein n=1 Tax=Streptomyces sp. NPDC047197 TaxID=3155477 RepID=UPI0033CA3E9C
MTMAPEKDAKWGWLKPSCSPDKRGRTGVTRHGTRLWCEETKGRWRWTWHSPPEAKEPCVDEGAWHLKDTIRSYVCRDGTWRAERPKGWRTPSPTDWPSQGPGKIPNPRGLAPDEVPGH